MGRFLLAGIGLIALCQAAHADFAPSGIVIHHSATDPGTKTENIRRYHVEERGWNDIGYHYIIETSGRIVKGRDTSTAGAHALNPRPSRNRTHIGICLIGHDAFTDSQYKALQRLLQSLDRRFGKLVLEKHHEQCPGDGLNWQKIRR